jgi:adenylate kinase family enzyme|tara:strand:+ start:380 stop:523 length:144 start_codon:yes stop_codon:yes gene_type:complete
MTEWNMTASQRKIQFFDDSKEDLEKKIESIEKKLDLIIDLLKNLKND